MYEQDFWAGHIDPEDREYAIDFCLKSSQRFKDYEFEYRMIAADGRIVWMHDIVSVTSVNGAPETLRGFMIDITERKQTEQALRKREQQLGAFFENSATDINLKDAEGRYILTSRQFEKTFGLARGEAEGKFPHDIFPKDFADHVRAQDFAVLRTGQLIHQEDLVPHRDPPITLLVSKFPISEETRRYRNRHHRAQAGGTGPAGGARPVRKPRPGAHPGASRSQRCTAGRSHRAQARRGGAVRKPTAIE